MAEFLFVCSPQYLAFFFFPLTCSKPLTCKSTIKTLRMPAVVRPLGTIHNTYSSTAVRFTLMEQVEAPFIIIIKRYFAVMRRFSSSLLKAALINCTAPWEVGSCCCPRGTAEEWGALTQLGSCPWSCRNSAAEAAVKPETPAPAPRFISG